MPITSTIQQGTLSLAAATPGNSAIGDAAAAGTSSSVARADHVHGREAAAAAGASAVGDTAAAGSATTVARSDHRHSREAFGTPVNLDASVTSLSAGSLTTVARADHIHTLSNLGGGVIIASTTLASAAANITFTNIPQIYKNLRIITAIKSAYTGANTTYMHLRYNSDGSASYPNQEQGLTTSPYTSGYGQVLQTSATTSTNSFNACEIVIYDYASTTNQKWSMSRGTFSAPSTTTNYYVQDIFRSWCWISTAAITSILIQDFASGTNFVAGSRATLYGFN